MLHKDFFRLIIKLFGLYSLTLLLFYVVPQYVPQLLISESLYSSFTIVLIVAVPVSLFLFLIFKADLIISALKLNKGFDGEKITFGEMTGTNILQLASIVIGGLLLIDNIPTFLNRLFFLFKESLQDHETSNTEYFYFGVSVVKIVIGYLMLRNFVWVGKLLRVKE